MELNHKYNFESLEHFFNDVTTPEAIISHLEILLQFLVYYSEKETVHGLYEVYCDIFGFKQALQQLTAE